MISQLTPRGGAGNYLPFMNVTCVRNRQGGIAISGWWLNLTLLFCCVALTGCITTSPEDDYVANVLAEAAQEFPPEAALPAPVTGSGKTNAVAPVVSIAKPPETVSIARAPAAVSVPAHVSVSAPPATATTPPVEVVAPSTVSVAPSPTVSVAPAKGVDASPVEPPVGVTPAPAVTGVTHEVAAVTPVESRPATALVYPKSVETAPRASAPSVKPPPAVPTIQPASVRLIRPRIGPSRRSRLPQGHGPGSIRAASPVR